MKISILGLGAYGIALSKAFYKNDNKVSIWSRFEDEVQSVLIKRENQRLLPGVKIPKEVVITSDLKDCIEKSKVIVIAVPATAVREVAKQLSQIITEEQVICIVTKGIEQKTNKLMSQVVFEETKSNNICFLSGPSFAKELADGTEEGLIVASEDNSNNILIKVCLENESIFVNTTKDIVGVQIAAAVKNVFAILLGICDGLKLSESTRAAILTCIVNDLRIIIEVLGGKEQTVFSYAGIGDLLLTCMSDTSRNYTLGKHIGQGLSMKEALAKMNTKTVEGVYTLKSITSILKKKEIQVKSISLVYDMLYGNVKEHDILRRIKR